MKSTEFIVNEMTMKAGSYEGLGRYINEYSHLDQTGLFAGDIEQYQVFRSKEEARFHKMYRYGVFQNEKIVAFFNVSGKGKLNLVYVVPEYRKQGLFSAILFFLKRNEGFSKINLGDYHSGAAYEAVKRIYKRFEKVYWEKDGKKIPYDPSTNDNFYSLVEPTGWQLILEHTGQNLESSKKFDPSNLGTWYFNLLD